jgi:hypothetical protein
MVDVPLGLAAYSRAPASQPEVILRNMIVEKDVSGAGTDEHYRIQRPGCAPYHVVGLTGFVRGLFYCHGLFDSMPVAAIGDTLYKFNADAENSLGTIANNGTPVEFAATNFGVAILSNTILYFHDGTTLSTVAIPDSKIPVSITSINSYVIIACSDGTWFWLVPGEIVIDPLHFATAETMPDGLVAVRAIRSEVYFFGKSTTEVWQPSTDPDLILYRAGGREWDRGCLARDTVQPLSNSAIMVGDDGVVYAVDGSPQRISNVGIEERIRKRSDTLTALTYTYDGHSVYALHIPGQGTFAYDLLTSNWAEFTTTGGTAGWLPRCAVAMGDTVLLGSTGNSSVLKLDANISTDDGVVFERAVSGTVAFNGGRQRHDNLEVHTGSSSNCTLRVRYHDGTTTSWSDYRTAIARAPSDLVRMHRFGAAKQPYRTIEISCVEDVIFRVSSAKANEGRAR